jgi:hypothetical protein
MAEIAMIAKSPQPISNYGNFGNLSKDMNLVGMTVCGRSVALS